jgi:hypothetical protein
VSGGEAGSGRVADRYGRRPSDSKRARWWIIGGTALVVVLAVLWYFFAGPGSTPVSTSGLEGDVSSSKVIDSRHIRISYTVNGLTDKPVACTIAAQSEDFTMVAWKVFVIPAGTEHSRSFTTTLKTTRLATAGLVDQCWVT